MGGVGCIGKADGGDQGVVFVELCKTPFAVIVEAELVYAVAIADVDYKVERPVFGEQRARHRRLAQVRLQRQAAEIDELGKAQSCV